MTSVSGIKGIFSLSYIVNVAYGACQYIDYIVRLAVETFSNFITVIIGEDLPCGYNMFTGFTLFTTVLASCHLYGLLEGSLNEYVSQICASRLCHLNIFCLDGFLSSHKQ